MEESESVIQIPLDDISDFSQRWTRASFISWSSFEYAKCCIVPVEVSEGKFSLGFNPGSCSIGCSILPPPHSEIYNIHTHTHINLMHELRAAPCPHSWPEVKKKTNPLTFHYILCHERTPHPLYLALYLLSYL